MNHKYTAIIFERLRKGEFICSNSTDTETVRLYDWIDSPEHFEELCNYFSAINFSLEKGDEYYHFSKKQEKYDIERKLEAAYRWIDMLDFLKSFDNSFGSGYSLSASEILRKIKADAILKTKADGLRGSLKVDEKAIYEELVEKLIDQLVKEGFAEVETDAVFKSYKVLSSIKYLETLVSSINIPEEFSNEIPK